ncbi:MAG: LysM peptidoglycan-binding domain-containing protein [Pseudomonadota bacterium]
MAKLALGAGTTVAGAAATVVVAAGAVAWFVVQTPENAGVSPAPALVTEAAQPAEAVDAAPDAEPVAEAAQASSEPATDEVVLANPSFDVVQVETDGQTLVAGVSEAGDVVDILIDDAVAGTATADKSGRFVAFLSVQPSDASRVMELQAGTGDAARRSDETVIISPFAGPQETELAALPTPPVEAPTVEAVEDTVAAVEEVAEAAGETVTDAQDAAPVVEETVAAAEDTAPVAEKEVAVAEETVAAAEDIDLAAEQTVDAEATLDAAEKTNLAEVAPVAVEEMANAEQPAAVPEAETKPTNTAIANVEEPATGPEASQKSTSELAMADVPAAEPTEVAPIAEQPAADDVAETAAGPAPTAPAVLLADQEGVRVLQSPQPVASVALDSITYDQAGDVSLSGRSPGDGFIRVYLDDRPITVSRITENGQWRTELPAVDTGVYRLRVDELDTEGQVVSRIETPFKREEPELVTELQADNLQTGVVQADVMTVQPGATLWAIAREKYGEGTLFVKVFEANKDRIRDPDLIYPGQIFDLPN